MWCGSPDEEKAELISCIEVTRGTMKVKLLSLLIGSVTGSMRETILQATAVFALTSATAQWRHLLGVVG